MKVHTLTLGALGTNCYLLEDEETKEALLIDLPDEAEKILQFVKELQVQVIAMVLTHGHFDHMLALKEVKEALAVPLWVHEKGALFLKDTVYNLCHYVGVDWAPIEADRLLCHGEMLSLGKEQLQVLHTPGHTEDCICLYGKGVLISGDTLFQGSVGRWDHPTGDMATEIRSIREKLMCLPDDTAVYPGHGPATTILDERKRNPYIQ